MAYNKFITKDGKVFLDLTNATDIPPEKLEKGLIAYDRHGYKIIGTGEYNLQEKGIITPTTEIQTILKDDGYYGLSSVTVDAIQTEEKTANTNGEVLPTEGKYLSKVVVDVQQNLQEKTVSASGVVIADEDYYGLSKVVVDIPDPELQDKEVSPTTEDILVSADEGVYGLSSVKVKAIQTEEKTTNINGDVTPTDGKYLSKVTVNVQPKLSTETFTPNKAGKTIVPSGDSYGLSEVVVNPIPDTYMEVPTEELTIDSNNSYDVINYAKVNVNVVAPEFKLQEKTITPTESSINVTPDSGYNGLGKVIINPTPLEEHREVTPSKDSTRIITPESGYLGLKKVTVNPIPNEYIIPLGTVSITENGTHNVLNYDSAIVNVKPALQSKEVTPSTAEQIITPDTGNYGLSSVKVNAIQTEEKTVDINGSVTPTSGKYLSKVTVNVQPTLQEKTITPTKESQIITADSGNYGLSKVIVDPISDEYIKPEGNLSITTNGTYDVTALASASVNIQLVLQEKTATTNGVIKPDSGYAGLSKVTVTVPTPKIVYSTGEPSDTTALWIKTNTNITSTKFTTNPPEKLTYNIGTLADTQRNAAAVAIGSGSSAKIWLLGGSNGSKYIDTIKIFDPATETITTITDDSITGLNMPRMSAAAYGNTIYFFGGYAQESSTEIHTFSISTNKLTTLSTVLPEAINSPTVVANGSKIYIFGGKNSSGTPINSITVFDANNNTATKLSVTLPSNGAYTNMAAVSANSKIYLFGGLKADGTRTAKINVFNPSAKTIGTSSAVLPSPADGITAVVASSNIYLFGGETGENALNTINTFDITKEEVATMKLKLPYKQSGIAAATSGTTCYLFGGGWNNTYYDTISRFTTVPTLDTNCALIELDYTKNSAHSLIPQIEAGIKSAYIKAGLATSTWGVYQYINDAWVDVTA